ncbi:MAG: hypothetical protein ACI4HZ_02665, partial [Ruminococcus sp.]
MSKTKTYILLITCIIAEIIILIIDKSFLNIFTGILVTVISLVNLLALLFYRLIPEIKGVKVLFIYLANLITFFYLGDAFGVSYFNNTYVIHYIAMGVAVGALCCIIETKVLKHKINLKNFIVTIICSGLLLLSMLSFVNVRLDFSDKKIITATVTDKSASSNRSLKYSLEITAKNDEYKDLTFGVDYKKSKGTNIGDSIDITCQKGLFGVEYYYYDNIKDKDFYYDFWSFFGVIVDDDDEFHSYVDS